MQTKFSGDQGAQATAQKKGGHKNKSQQLPEKGDFKDVQVTMRQMLDSPVRPGYGCR
jgi:hypothetical protein